MSERLFGARVRRREDARLVTGRGRYVADIELPGMLHVAVHRSPHAHARLVTIDAGEARRRPGVVHAEQQQRADRSLTAFGIGR